MEGAYALSFFFNNMDKNDKIIIEIIDKQLEKYGVNCEFVKLNKEIEGIPWYQYYTFDTKEEYENWKKFSINLMMKKLRFKKDYAEKNFGMLDLNYGLKHSYDNC